MTQPNNILRKMKNLQALFKTKLTRLIRVRSWNELKQSWELVFYALETARQELQLMAKSMIQMTVVIRVREPATRQFRGHAKIDSRGVRVIDVHPLEAAFGLDRFYEVVLHEICHHLYHIEEKDRMPPIVSEIYSLIARCVPRIIDLKKSNNEYIAGIRAAGLADRVSTSVTSAFIQRLIKEVPNLLSNFPAEILADENLPQITDLRKALNQ